MESLIKFLDQKIDAMETRIVERIDKLESHVDNIRMSRAKAAGAMAMIAIVMELATHLFEVWYKKG